MKKTIILIALAFLISGCSSEYNLKITSDKIEENINVAVDKSLIGSDAGNPDDPINPTDPDDQITPFLERDQYPFIGNYSIRYDKDVTEDDENYYVQFRYSYLPSEYGNSRWILYCFQNHEYTSNDEFYEIKLSGMFDCLYSDSLTIRLNTPNIVEEHNAQKVEDDTYIWTIDSSNKSNTNISIKILKKTTGEEHVTYGFFVGLILVGLIIGFFLLKFFIKRRSCNKI